MDDLGVPPWLWKAPHLVQARNVPARTSQREMEDMLRSVTNDFQLQMPRSSERKCKGYAFVEGGGTKSGCNGTWAIQRNRNGGGLEVSRRQGALGTTERLEASWLSEGITPKEARTFAWRSIAAATMWRIFLEYPWWVLFGWASGGELSWSVDQLIFFGPGEQRWSETDIHRTGQVRCKFFT